MGIPTVRDRVVQTCIKMALEPFYEHQFSSHSYGFRRNVGARQAVEQAKTYVESGYEVVVDIDLARFFDTINHDKLIDLLRCNVSDSRVLRLIGMSLRSGILTGSSSSSEPVGSPQGSPLSPLLGNILLNELDQELERRGHKFCRYAYDIAIFVRTTAAGNRVLQSTSTYLERRLKLRVNRDKSMVALAKQVSYLGFTVLKNTIAISKRSIDAAMRRIKELTPRGCHEDLYQTMQRVNKWYRGYVGYYGFGQYPAQLHKLEAHIRRRMRSRIIAHKKKRRHLFRALRQRGVRYRTAKRSVYGNDGRWAMSKSPGMHRAYPNLWFKRDLGQRIVSDEKRITWRPVKQWPKLV